MKLTYFRQRRHEYPERDDEGNLDPLELDVEDVVLGRVAVAAVGGVVVVPDWHGVLTHSFLMKQLNGGYIYLIRIVEFSDYSCQAISNKNINLHRANQLDCKMQSSSNMNL